MDSPHAQAIADEILNGNFPRAAGLAEAWLQELPLNDDTHDSAGVSLPSAGKPGSMVDRADAEEAYEISRYLMHRHERLSSLAPGMERGHAFEAVLQDMVRLGSPQVVRLRAASGSQAQRLSVIRRAVVMLCHAQIADNFARDFAGQKNYQLQLRDQLKLAYSLLMIANFTSAREVLAFILANNPTNAGAHYMAAHAANMSGNEQGFFEHYRDALYLKPEVVSEYPEFMPGGLFLEMFKLVHEEDYGEGVRERIYALLLEVNGVYRHRRKLKIDEARVLESEFQKLRQEYAAARVHKKVFEPRLLQLLAMLIIHAQQMQNFDKFESYRSEMIAIDNSIWQTFHQNNLVPPK